MSSKSCQAVKFTPTICSQHDAYPSGILPRRPNLSLISPARSLSSSSPQIISPHPHPLSRIRQKKKNKGIIVKPRPLPPQPQRAPSEVLVLAGHVDLVRVKVDHLAALVRHGGLLHRGAAAGRLLPSLEACTSLAMFPSHCALGSVVTYRGGWRSRERRGRRGR